MTYVRDAWEAEPGSVVCRHGGQVAMDNEGLVRHKGTGRLCDLIPVPRLTPDMCRCSWRPFPHVRDDERCVP